MLRVYLAILVLALPAVAFSQGAAEDAERPALMEEVVVTGVPGGAEIRKLDASFAITSADADEIRKFSPNSTAWTLTRQTLRR